MKITLSENKLKRLIMSAINEAIYGERKALNEFIDINERNNIRIKLQAAGLDLDDDDVIGFGYDMVAINIYGKDWEDVQICNDVMDRLGYNWQEDDEDEETVVEFYKKR